MPIFRLNNIEDGDMSKAELVIAQETALELERYLENWLENSPYALTQEPLLWIGRQTSAQDKEGTIFPDLLGVDSEGNLVIVELKKDRAPREVVAQLLEYAAWVDELSNVQIHGIAKDYFNKHEGLKGKTFDDAFREVFDMPETDEIPTLNRTMRLFIVAEEIPTRVARVCRFLRTSQGMDISCIDISTFQTEAGERLVSMEAKIGDEDISTSKTQKQRGYRNSPWLGDEPLGEVVWKTVQEFTARDPKRKFTLIEIERAISEKYHDFNESGVRRLIRGGCVNFPRRSDYPEGYDRYWRISRGIYRLYNPETDKMENAEETG